MPSGAPVIHGGSITSDETWVAGIHEVTSTVTVSGGTLTIEPCSEVRLAANASIELSQTATALIADGTAADPITFVRDDATKPWGHLSAFAPSKLDLAYATLDGGGTAGDYTTADQLGAALVIRGSAALEPILHVDHVTVDNASGIAVFLNQARFVPGSTALTVSHAGAYPLFLGADTATDVPDGAYTSNAHDEILLQTSATAAAFEQSRTLLADVTLHDRGVPYRVGLAPAVIVVADGIDGHPPVTLTIEAGVTMKFAYEGASSSSRIQVRGLQSGSPQGVLVAVGTAAKPITFTSGAANPSPGDWQGLEFRGGVDGATAIEHAVIEDAGGPSFSVGVCVAKPAADNAKEDSAVIISLALGAVPPPFITNTQFIGSAGGGVYRGWRVDDVDFIGSNTFTNVAGCLQSNVPNAANACPLTTCPTN